MDQPNWNGNRERRCTALVLISFFLPGFAASLDQIIWQKTLAIGFGIDAYPIAITASTSMAGLGFCNLFGGYIADRLCLRKAIPLFGLSEGVIAAFAPGGKILSAEKETVLYVLKKGSPGTMHMYVNGVKQSWLPYGIIHALKGIVPEMIPDDPQPLALIGLGSGEMAFAAGSLEERRSRAKEVIHV
jgi:MFS family permease